MPTQGEPTQGVPTQGVPTQQGVAQGGGPAPIFGGAALPVGETGCICCPGVIWPEPPSIVLLDWFTNLALCYRY